MQAAEKQLLRQFKAALPTLAVLYLAATGVFAGIVIVRLTTDISLSYFVRDPASLAGERAYFGMISNLGIVLWAAAAAVSLFTYVVLRRDGDGRQRAHFFLFAGLLTLLLLLDDLFLFHENIKRETVLPESLLYAVYGALFLLFIRAYMPLLLETEYALMLLAGGFFAFSTAYDIAVGAWRADDLFEDGAKFFGILTWCAYLTRTALYAVQAAAGKEDAPAQVAAQAEPSAPASPAPMHDYSRQVRRGHVRSPRKIKR